MVAAMAPSGSGPRFVAQGPRTTPRRRARGSRLLGGLLLCVLACWVWVQTPSVTPGSTTAFVSSGFLKQALIPAGALAVGFGLYAMNGGSKTHETAAIVMIYFGAQTGMNLYMKSVLSNIVIDEEEGLNGIPIGFLLTAIQQFVAFGAFCLFVFGGKLCGSGYKVKQLEKKSDYLAVILFSMTFALNIGLNNFSLSMVAISINLIIRSCLPLSTALSQTLVNRIMGGEQKSVPVAEWVLMSIGVAFAALATYCKNFAGGSSEDAAPLIGVICCVASIFSGALNMVLAGVLGNQLKLNPVDTTCYMALPAGLVLLLPALLVSHPMGKWPGFPDMTDWQVLTEVMARNPNALIPVLFSGVLSFIYNIMVYTMVHKLSAGFASFAGNFNKAATVALSLILGLESLPTGNYAYLFIFAVLGNIGVFTLYSARATGGK
mmetsp:Transcript_38031/g.100605  ORF Transcript_38031/g.100605 Transcript_38031/m.100605 type:complete len:433 (-) Transcript_38031:69-1367(-)